MYRGLACLRGLVVKRLVCDCGLVHHRGLAARGAVAVTFACHRGFAPRLVQRISERIEKLQSRQESERLETDC